MTFQPVIPLSGYTGWRFLQRTLPAQKEAFNNSADLKREIAYFRDSIQSVKTAEDLVSDRRLLRVALTAFGLEGDLDSRFFVKKILEDGTSDTKALANRLADSRYKDFSDALGFDSVIGPKTQFKLYTDDIIRRYEGRRFEEAVGQANPDLRLALNLDTSLKDLTSGDGNDKSKWFKLMGTPPLRKVMETALGMPAGFGALDLDYQLTQFKSRAKSTFGTDSIEELAGPEHRDKLTRLFLVRSEAAQLGTSTNGAQTALTLLSNLPNLWANPL